jgi:hypothetical protein
LFASEYGELYRIAYFAFEYPVYALFVEGADILAVDQGDFVAGV